MKREVEDVKPDLVIWQLGTNDAMRHVAMEASGIACRKTLAWLEEQRIDVILINPQYGDSLIKDAYYEEVVTAIADIAREMQVPLVDRFDAMRKLQRERGSHFDLSADDLHMNDEGYRHLAKHVAATIIAALPQRPQRQAGRGSPVELSLALKRASPCRDIPAPAPYISGMPDQIATRCCIAGGGPAGMMLGFLLARAGVDVSFSKNMPTFCATFAATRSTPPPSRSCTSWDCWRRSWGCRTRKASTPRGSRRRHPRARLPISLICRPAASCLPSCPNGTFSISWRNAPRRTRHSSS